MPSLRRRRPASFSRAATLVAVACCILAAGSQPAASRRTAAAPANLYVSTSGSDDGPCSQAQPCRTLGRAYARASRGDVVEVAGGSYGGEKLRGAPGGAAGIVLFRPAAGQRVQIQGELRLENAAHVEFRDLAIGDYYIAYGEDIAFRNIVTAFFFVRSSKDVRIVGGSVGGVQSGVSPTIGSLRDNDPPATNILIDGVTFHDIGRQEKPDAHVQCLFVQETVGLVMRNSRFTRCGIMDLFVNDIAGGPVPQQITIENNWFDDPVDGYYAVNIRWDPGDVIRDYRIAYNSFGGTLLLRQGTYENTQVYGNVGRLSDCAANTIQYAYNVWSNVRCSATDRQAPSGFADEGSFDLHLAPGSKAIGAGDPDRAPATDIDGDRRPLRARPDAGADQREPASAVAAGAIGRVRLGMTEAGVVAAYGRPRSVRRVVDAGRPVRRASYRVPGGTLWVDYDGDRVVQVGTTSAYYTTRAGAGVGAGKGSFGRLVPGTCKGNYRRAAPGGVVVARIARSRIASFSFVRRAYAGCRR